MLKLKAEDASNIFLKALYVIGPFEFVLPRNLEIYWKFPFPIIFWPEFLLDSCFGEYLYKDKQIQCNWKKNFCKKIKICKVQREMFTYANVCREAINRDF